MVGQRIRYYRKTKGLTQEELAQGICSVSYLSKIEKGDAKSSEEVINLLCERLGISSEEVDSDEILELLNEWNMMMIGRRFDEAKEHHQQVQEKMAHVNDPELLIRYELFKARCYLSLQPVDLDTGYEIINKIKELKEQLSPELSFYYFVVWGMYYNYQLDYKLAIQSLTNAEKIYNTNSNINDSDAAVLYYLLALSYSHIMRISSVNAYAHKAIRIFDKEYNYSRSADCQILLAISFRRAQNYDQAEFHLNQALKYSQSFNDRSTSAIIYHNLGYVYSCKKQHSKAIESFKKSLGYKKEYSPERIASTIFLLSQEYFFLNDFRQAQEWIEKGLSYLNGEKNQFYYHLNILKYRIEKPNSPEFDSFMSKEAIPFFEKSSVWEFISNYSELLADSFFEQGQYKKASQYYRIANNSRKNIF